MKALENRTLDSKREMDIMTALDEMKSLKSRHEQVWAGLGRAGVGWGGVGREGWGVGWGGVPI